MLPRTFHTLAGACLLLALAGPGLSQPPQGKFEPFVGQEGKDVIWVPTPYALVETMLDVAQVTPQDYVVDLGSGDGRNVIAAAKRGARALGVEYNPDMVALSTRNAAAHGVAERAKFVQGDMYEADISEATVLALFLLPHNLSKLTPKFLALRPGARIVTNGYRIDGWDADETVQSSGECGSWCTAHLYIVPARVAGKWRLAQGELVLEQEFGKLTGTLAVGGDTVPISEGRLRGDEITFRAGDVLYAGRVDGETMRGVNDGARETWMAVRVPH